MMIIVGLVVEKLNCFIKIINFNKKKIYGFKSLNLLKI